MKARIEFDPHDLWLGCYWKVQPKWKKVYWGTLRIKLELWICLLPMLPLHLMFGK